jgi:hypothetical protein
MFLITVSPLPPPPLSYMLHNRYIACCVTVKIKHISEGKLEIKQNGG